MEIKKFNRQNPGEQIAFKMKDLLIKDKEVLLNRLHEAKLNVKRKYSASKI
jgi:hypothetical protein